MDGIQMKLPNMVHWKEKWYNHFVKLWQSLTKLKFNIQLLQDLVILLLDIYSRQIKLVFPFKDFFMNVHSTFSIMVKNCKHHMCPVINTKANVAFPCNEILLCNKKGINYETQSHKVTHLAAINNLWTISRSRLKQI